MAQKAKTFFDHLNAVLKVQDPYYWDELDEVDKKSWNTYMMMRYLSMNPNWIEVIDIIQQYVHSLNPKHVYRLLIQYIPKGRNFIKYIKKDKKDEVSKDILNKLANYYECSVREAEIYTQLLSYDELEKVVAMFGGEIELKKLKQQKKRGKK